MKRATVKELRGLLGEGAGRGSRVGSGTRDGSGSIGLFRAWLDGIVEKSGKAVVPLMGVVEASQEISKDSGTREAAETLGLGPELAELGEKADKALAAWNDLANALSSLRRSTKVKP